MRTADVSSPTADRKLRSRKPLPAGRARSWFPVRQSPALGPPLAVTAAAGGGSSERAGAGPQGPRRACAEWAAPRTPPGRTDAKEAPAEESAEFRESARPEVEACAQEEG